MKAKKRNPNDATLRNIRALKKRATKLEKDFKVMAHALKACSKWAHTVESRLQMMQQVYTIQLPKRRKK